MFYFQIGLKVMMQVTFSENILAIKGSEQVVALRESYGGMYYTALVRVKVEYINYQTRITIKPGFQIE